MPKTFENNKFNGGLSPSRVVMIGLIIGALLLLREVFVIVESGHVGVVRMLGAVQPVSLPEGFHFKKPILDRVEQMDIRLTKAENAAQAASKDLQTVSTKVTVQYSLDGAVAPLTFQKIGTRGIVASTLINPAIMESVKSVTAQYTAEELITKRALVKVAIQNEISGFVNTTLQQKGAANALSIANVAITDFDFSAEFNRAIELKVRAEQEALKAENDKIRRVTQAEAAAAERNLAADAEAYAIEIESKSRADAIRREAAALKNNPELIQLRLAEKWDGVLPKVSGDGAIPLINMQGLDTSTKARK
ncbi:MAG: prohibitin family protein [Gammaproteobacteria bacterium]|nr:prohibitin family protein [Gammaproteobacteria bacterium]RZV57583.1 MAG: prohibitin family protein [Pseudomonadales bacterium]